MRTEVMIIAFGTLTKEKTERKKKLSFFNILSYDVWVCVVLLCVAHISILSKAYYLQYGYFR